MVDRLRIDHPDLLTAISAYQEPATPSSTIAQVGRVAERSSMRTRKPSARQKDITSEGIRDNHTRVTKKQTGKGKGKSRTETKTTSKTRKPTRHSTPQKPSQSTTLVNTSDREDEAVFPESSPIKEGRDSDSDFDIEAAERVRPSRKTQSHLPSRPYFETEADAIIEQWYTDPYERINPDTEGYLEWRRRNLQAVMGQQGWALKHANEVVAWLLRCEGHYKAWDRGRNEKKMKAWRKRKQVHFNDEADRKTQDVSKGPQDSAELMDIDPVVDDANKDDYEDSTYQSGISSLISKTPSAEPRSGKKGGILKIKGPSASQKETATEAPDSSLHLEDKLIQGRSYDELDDVTKIKVIKRSLDVFDIVYGDNLPEPDYVNFEIDHLSRVTNVPKPRPISGYRTQGHGNLRLATLLEGSEALRNHIRDSEPILPWSGDDDNDGSSVHGNEGRAQNMLHSSRVWTEDPSFGIRYGNGPEWFTPEELAEQKIQRAAEEAERAEIARAKADAEENARQVAYFAGMGLYAP